MDNLDAMTKENINKHNLNWPHIHDHLYRILIIGGSGSGKTLFNLIIIINNHQNHSNDKDGIYDGIWIAFKNKSK